MWGTASFLCSFCFTPIYDHAFWTGKLKPETKPVETVNNDKPEEITKPKPRKKRKHNKTIAHMCIVCMNPFLAPISIDMYKTIFICSMEYYVVYSSLLYLS